MPLRRLREPPAWLPPLNPFAAAGRAIRHFHPRHAPPMARANYRRELAASAFLPFALALVEGGVLGVIVRRYFDVLVTGTPEAPPTLDAKVLNFAVAAVTAAPAFANIASFLFVRLAHGRDKVRSVNTLQVLMAGLVSVMALAPVSPGGLAMVIGCGIAARLCYAGVVTLRSSVWRANYPRHTRARLTGRIAAIQTLATAVVGGGIGLVLEANEDAFRLAVPAVAAVSLIGVRWWSRLRVRGHAAMLRAEREAPENDRPSFNPARMWAVLAGDGRFAAYMSAQFLLGFGNMMIFAVITILTQEVFGLNYIESMLATQVLPYLAIPVFVGAWSGLLDRWHVVKYRSVHSWVFVLMSLCFAASIWAGSVWLLYLAALLRGIGFAGGAIAWNLGHNDFANDDNAAQYMAVHVTLTGIRGLIAPFAGVALYEFLRGETAIGPAGVFVLSALMIAAAAVWFIVLASRLPRS